MLTVHCAQQSVESRGRRLLRPLVLLFFFPVTRHEVLVRVQLILECSVF